VHLLGRMSSVGIPVLVYLCVLQLCRCMVYTVLGGHALPSMVVGCSTRGHDPRRCSRYYVLPTAMNRTITAIEGHHLYHTGCGVLTTTLRLRRGASVLCMYTRATVPSDVSTEVSVLLVVQYEVMDVPSWYLMVGGHGYS
jgi:hypothetical protein